ncbi:uncharacterized protein LOC131226294 [Magnolia sinica]|uniref:uncharacterized protein LOC131226294 n=1 Tax=Magnolia sinica TaxID=86752 RepID=UPI0026594CC6|nr:uncharacterized protein LOC131226294 [Magnolia sinica]
MGKDRNGSLPERDRDSESPSRRDRSRRSKRRKEESDGSSASEDDERTRSKRKHSRRRYRRRDDSSSSESSYSESESDGSDSSEEEEDKRSEGEDEMSRRKRKERRRREREREYEKERQRRKEKKRRRREKEGRDEKKKRKKEEDKKKKKKKEKDKKGAVTNSWGKYGIIRETDMWNKRPEFTAWLAEVKQVNLESLPNWEEKQMFKEFMEDHNTATFPSKKYYGLDAYHQRKMTKEMKKGLKKILQTERTVFNDEEQRRLELLVERERQKEEQVETLKRSMQGGMAQAMKEQAQLREEMAYQYRVGNFEAAAAIQRRLDPDVAM